VSRLKLLAANEQGVPPLGAGHSLCQGCGIPIVVRTVLDAIPGKKVVISATGCLEVATTRFPTTAWNVPWVHVAFENAAAVASGVESGYRALRRRHRLDEDITFVAFAGDGGTYDIGMQALSGALERGHRFVFCCYDNEAYMNTGVQRSGATPFGASTTTSPSGEVGLGKLQERKDMTAIAVAHHVPYVAQAAASHWYDRRDAVLAAVRGRRRPVPADVRAAGARADRRLAARAEAVQAPVRPEERRPRPSRPAPGRRGLGAAARALRVVPRSRTSERSRSGSGGLSRRMAA